MSPRARLAGAFALLAWLPLALLAAGELLATGEWPSVLLRFETHIRLLVAGPVLIAADGLVRDRIAACLGQLGSRGYVPASEGASFDALVASYTRYVGARRTDAAVGLLVLLSVLVEPAAAGAGAAATWDRLVATPAFRFVLVRTLAHWLCWARLLARLSQLRLALVATHADGAGGLGFLAQPSQGFSLTVLGTSTLLSARWATGLVLGGLRFEDIQGEVTTYGVLVTLLALAPLLVFARPLIALKEEAIRDYGAFVRAYCERFREKWVAPGRALEALGASDIQSLADLDKAFEVIESIRPFPFPPRLPVMIALCALLPVAPLALKDVPMNEIALKLLKAM